MEKEIGETPQVKAIPSSRLSFGKEEANEFAAFFIAAVKRAKGSLLKHHAAFDFLPVTKKRFEEAIMNNNQEEAELALSDTIPLLFSLWLRTKAMSTSK